MSAAPDTVVLARSREDDEGLFSRREIDGLLVRVDKPTREQLDKRIRIWIDGQAVQTTVARPRTDAQGNPLQDRDEMQIARHTTIYDAAARLYGESAVRTHIPALCHQPHMNPVAVCRVCRVCSIQVGKVEKAKDGKPFMKLDRRLRPVCQTPVTENMHVFTLNAKRMLKEWPRGYLAPVTRKDIEKALEAVRRAVTGLTYLLADDHLAVAPGAAGPDDDGDNELRKILSLHCQELSPFKSLTLHSTTGDRPVGTLPGSVDDSSPVFSVDHSACILCDRCSRACSDVKDNNVIGRTGKGAHVGIGFDLNVPMGDSSRVQCGECMISCPTSAITFRPVALVKTAIRSDEPKLTTAELSQDVLLKDLPSKFLRWQEGLIVRRFVFPPPAVSRAQ